MKFQQLSVDADDTHLDHSELEENASLRQMDRDGDGKVTVMGVHAASGRKSTGPSPSP